MTVPTVLRGRGRTSDFGDGEECGLSAACDERVGDPVFGDVVLVPEVWPVDEHVDEFVECLAGRCGVAAEPFVGGFFPVAAVSGLCPVAEAGVAAFGYWCVGGEDDEGVVAVVVDAG